LLSLVLWLFLAPSSRAAEGDALGSFEAAVAAYQAGDLETARHLWETLLADPDLSDADRAIVAYDLGNLAFREQRFLEAATRYHAVIELEPRHADAWHNLELARSRAGLEAADRGDLAATVERLLAAPTGEELALVTWLGLALFGLALLWEIRRGGLLPRCAAGLGLVLALSAMGLGTWRQVNALEDPAMVQASGGASLRVDPDPELPVIESLEPGHRVELLERYAGWARVRADEATGWLRGEEVLELFPRP